MKDINPLHGSFPHGASLEARDPSWFARFRFTCDGRCGCRRQDWSDGAIPPGWIDLPDGRHACPRCRFHELTAEVLA